MLPTKIFTRIIAFFLRPIIRIPLLILSLILYGITALAAFGGRFNPDIFTLPGTLTLLLPGLAIATACVTLGWFLIRGYIGGSLGVLTILICWGPISTAVPFGTSKKPDPGAKTFTLLTWNMRRGWDQENKSDSIHGNRSVQYILDTDADVVCLQELSLMFERKHPHRWFENEEVPFMTESQREALFKKYPYYAGYNDMKVLSKYPMERELGHHDAVSEMAPLHYSFYKLKIGGHPLTIVTMHLASFELGPEEQNVVRDMTSASGFKKSVSMLRTDIHAKLQTGFRARKKDVTALRQAIDGIKGPLVICGDFNDVPESYAYRLLRGDDLKDAYVETGFGPLVTFNRHAFWVHLDQVFYRGDLRPLSIKKGTTKVSDHYPLLTEFEFLPR